MTTDPHLEADCAWLEGLRPAATLPPEIAEHAQQNARIDRLIARAKVAGGVETDLGWLYASDDHAVEWSQDHPIESGEVPDAKDVRPANAEHLLVALKDSWDVQSDLQSRIAEPFAPASPVGGDLANALTMTGCKTEEDLIDMANVGSSLMDSIGFLANTPGPFQHWMPAQDPAEIVFDLVNALDEALASPTPTPPGHKLVPLKHTEAMYGAGFAAWAVDGTVGAVWDAMVEVAPPPASIPEED